jgi:multimeric flavodoxin WrbA
MHKWFAQSKMSNEHPTKNRGDVSIISSCSTNGNRLAAHNQYLVNIGILVRGLGKGDIYIFGNL